MCRAGSKSQINNDARIDVGLFEGDFVEGSQARREIETRAVPDDR